MVARYTYNAWGELTYSSGSMAEINPLRYRGYYYDTETGLYYLQSRYYDPVTHRFINADSIASTGQGIIGTNMFAYCNNSPVMYSDHTGHILKPFTEVICDGGGGGVSNTDVVVLSFSDEAWITTSETMGEQFASGIGGGNVRVEVVTSENFEEVWSTITESYVIIHTHGSPSSLAGYGLIVSLEDVQDLETNYNIEGILITACSTGGIDGSGTNIAQAMSQKIGHNGLILCSSTIVSGYDKYFTATDNGAWIFYRNGSALNKRIPATISVYEIAEEYFS